jgi:hypothetical protein
VADLALRDLVLQHQERFDAHLLVPRLDDGGGELVSRDPSAADKVLELQRPTASGGGAFVKGG